MSEWQPIETATRREDGDTVLLLCDGHPDDYQSRVYLGFWGVGAYGDNKAGWWDWGCGLDGHEFDGHEEWAALEPTHWMPLPAPPVLTEVAATVGEMG